MNSAAYLFICERLIIMKIKRFLLNGFFLTAGAVITNTLGLFFRIYMSSSIGAEAIGLYQLILTVYFFAVTATASGVTLLVTRLVTEAAAKKEACMIKSIIRRCMLTALALSAVVGAVLFFGSSFWADCVLKQPGAAVSLRVLAPSLPFIAVSACLRGYFFAMRQAVKTAGEQLLEQITEIGVFAVLVGVMAPYGIAYACCAVAIGTTVSEAVTAVYSYLLYKLDVRRIKCQSKCFPIKKHLIFIALPVTLSACLRSGLSIIENSTIPAGLQKYGFNHSRALQDYGMITGMVMPLLAFPSVVIFSFASIIIPELSEVYTKSDKVQIKKISSNVLKTVFLFSIPIAVAFFFFGKEIGLIIYGSETVGRYLCMFAAIVPIIYLDSVVDSMLKGLNQQLHYLTYNILDSFIRVVLVTLLIPKYGLMGLITVMYIGSIFNTGLSLLRLVRVAEIKIKLVWILLPLALSTLVFSAIKGVISAI